MTIIPLPGYKATDILSMCTTLDGIVGAYTAGSRIVQKLLLCT